MLLLFAYREHTIWIERTRLNFSVTLGKLDITYDASVMLDTHPVSNGEQVGLGPHALRISHPKGDTFSTNLFIWYGGHNLGQIVLKRSVGTLSIQADPPASSLVIRGPEFAITLRNTRGMTSSVPTDAYSVEAAYLHWNQVRELAVIPHSSAFWSFAPKLGTLQLTCDQTGASFQVWVGDAQLLEAGEFPSTIREVPAGPYKMVAFHHGNRHEETISVAAGITNNALVEFAYGAAVLDTEPPGATVIMADGRSLGVTPITVIEMKSGTWKFTLRRDGYEQLPVVLDISAKQTNTFRTNLVSIDYLQAVAAARQALAAANFDRAWLEASNALLAKPNDPHALAVQN